MLGLSAIGQLPISSLVGENLLGTDTLLVLKSGDNYPMTFVVEARLTELNANFSYARDPSGIGCLPISSLPNEDLLVAQPERVFYFSNRAWVTLPNDVRLPNSFAYPRLLSLPSIQRTLPVYPEEGRRVQENFGAFEVANSDRDFDYIVDEYRFSSTIGRLYIGKKGESFSNMEPASTFIGRSVDASDDRLSFNVDSASIFLNSPIADTFTGRGGQGGDTELEGASRPLTFGEVRNVSPTLVNKDLWVYQVHDGPIAAIDAVYDLGVALTDSGVDVPTWAALRALDLAAGEYATCLALGAFRAGLGVAGPAGVVTADVRGETVDGEYSNLTGPILLRIIENRGKVSPQLLNRGQINDISAARPIGYFVQGGAALTVEQVVDDLVRNVNGWYGPSRRNEAITAGVLASPTNQSATLFFAPGEVIEIEPAALDRPPRYDQGVIYDVNWTPLTEAQVSLALGQSVRERFIDVGERTKVSNAEIRLRDRGAISGGEIVTYYNTLEDARAFASELLELYRETAQKWRVVVRQKGYLTELGGVISITHPRYGCESGRNFMVIGRRDSANGDTVELTLWG